MEVLPRFRCLWLHKRSLLLGVPARDSRYPAGRSVLSLLVSGIGARLLTLPAELDDYFSRVPLFVPGSHVVPRDANAREDELRQGRIVVGGHEEDVKIDEDLKSEKA